MKYIFLLIIPIAILFNINYNNKVKFSYDPDFAYLFNALNFADTYGNVRYYDHPGTPVIVTSAIIMKITYKVRKTDNDFAIDVLRNPQLYLKVIAWVFTWINSLMILILGIFIFRLTKEISYSLLFQSIPYFSKTVLIWSFQNISPEPLVLASVIIYLMLFMWKYYYNKSFGEINLKYSKDKSITIDKFLIFFGLIIGFGLATKINAFPLLILAFLFIPGFKNKLIFSIIGIFSFFIFTIPIVKHYPSLFLWFKGITTHTDIYGGGEVGFINLKSFYENFITFVNYDPIVFYTIVFSLVIIIKQIIQKKFDINLKILIGLFLVQIVDLIVVLKHFNLHYFIPVIPTIALSLFIILQIFNLSKIIKIFIIIPFIALCLYLNTNFTKNISSEYQPVDETGCINIYSFGCNSPIYGLKFGDDFAMNKNSANLEKAFGKQYFYDIWTTKFSDWKDTIPQQEIFKLNKTIYLYAIPQYLKEYPTPFTYKIISDGKYLIENNPSDTLEVK